MRKPYLLVVWVLLSAATVANGADQTWITGAADKSWNPLVANWNPAGTVNPGWDNGNNAIFGTIGETLTVTAPITVGNMTFTVPTYVINGTSPSIITFANSNALIDTSAAGGSGGTTQINAILAGTLPNGLTVMANGAIATGAGQGLKLGGVNTFTGDITIAAGDLTVTSNSAFGNAANKIILNGGGLLDPNLSLANPHAIQVLANGGWIRLYGNVTAAAVYSGLLTGAGTLVHSDGGILTLSGDMSGFTGTFDQQGGGLSTGGVAGSAAITGVLPFSNGNWITSAGTLGFDLGRFGTAGTITMNGGTLQWRGSSLIRPSVANDDVSARIVMALGKTATFDTGNNTVTIAGSFQGDPSFAPVTKIGTGQLNLTGNVVTGGTNINAGVLSIQGSLSSNGTINVNNTGTLNVSGGLDPLSFVSVNSGGTLVCNLASGKTLGSVTLATGGTISPGAFTTSGYIGTLRADSLTVNGGTLIADVGSTTNDLSVITGLANFAGAAVVQLRFAGAPTAGQRTLLTAGSIAGTLPTLTTVPANTRYSVVPGGTLTDVFVTISGSNKDLVWSTTTGTWDVNSSPNWNSGADTFFNMDNVTFGQIAADSTVTLPLNLSPNNMTIANDTNMYTFTGGIINGTGTLTKNGTGSATIAGTQPAVGGTSFTNCVVNGGILIFNCGYDQRDGMEFNGIVTINSGGTLQLGNTRLGTANTPGINNLNIGTQIVINGGTLDVWERTDIGKITMTGGSIIGTAGTAGPGRLWQRSAGMQTLPASTTAAIANGAWSLADNTVFNVGKGTTPNGIDLTISAIIDSPNTNYGIRKTGLGTMNITGACTYPFGTIIDAGTLSITGSGAISNVATNIVTINANGTFTLGRNDTWGGHTANVVIPIVINGGTMTNGGNNYNTLGPLTLNGGTLTGTGGANANFQMWALKGPVTVNANAAASTISGTGNFSNIALGQAAVTGTAFTVADGAAPIDLVVSAQLYNGRDSGNTGFQPSSLTKAGPGTMSLTGVNLYTGATNVIAGTLIVDGSIDALSAVSVASGAKLRGTGDGTNTGIISGTVSTTAGAFIIPGDTKGTTAAKGTLTVGSLNMTTGGTINIRVSNSAAMQADQLKIFGNTNLDLSAATLAVQVEAGSYGNQTAIVVQTTAGNFITKKFGTVPSDSAIKVEYLDSTNAVVNPDGVTPATYAAKVRLTLGAGVTPATIGSFAAKAEGAGALLTWNSISEFQNAGFNLYRRAASQESRLRGSGWTRVTPALIPGRITNSAPKIYSFYDWASPGVYEYKLETVSLAGIHESYSANDFVAIEPATISVEGIAAALNSIESLANFQRTESVRELFAARGNAADHFDGIAVGVRKDDRPLIECYDRKLDPNKNEPLASAARAAQSSSAPMFAAAMRGFSNVPIRTPRSSVAAKVEYQKTGVLRIKQSDLPAGFDINRVSVQREGRALTALAVTPDSLLAYAPGYTDDYTSTDALFLRRTATPTPSGAVLHATGLFNSSLPVNADTFTTNAVEFHDVYFDYSLRPYKYAPWFSSKYLTNGTTQEFSLATPFASTASAALLIDVWSLTETEHALQVLINGTPSGDLIWSGGGQMLTLGFNATGLLPDRPNRIELVTPDNGTNQIAFIHSMLIAYTRQLDGSQPLEIHNATTQAKLFELSNVPSANAWVVDARVEDRATLVPYQTQQQADGTYKLRFSAPSGGSGKFLVVPAGLENAPVAISKRTLKPIKSSPYLAVGPGKFESAAQPLLALRSKEGLRATFADQDQVFDYYNFGRFGPAGIQNAVRATHPQFLVLLGRTTYDYRNFTGANVDPRCPAFLVSTNFWAQATSDSLYGDLGRGIPEVAVGRLPVNNADELKNAVSRITAYRGAPSSGLRLHATCDFTDPAVADFSTQAESIRASNPDLSWQQNYLGVNVATSREATTGMTAAANGGADWLLYVGHGNAVHLGKDDPRILDTNLVQQWTGSAVFLQATCTANWMAMDEANYRSIAIQALTQPQGGISASIASSTYMNADAGAAFMSQLLKLTGTSPRWGTALLKAQQWSAQQSGSGVNDAFYGDLMTTEQLFGDPAMPVRQSAKPNAQSPTSPGSF